MTDDTIEPILLEPRAIGNHEERINRQVIVLDSLHQGKSNLALFAAIRHMLAGGTVIMVNAEGERVDLSEKLRMLVAADRTDAFSDRPIASGRALMSEEVLKRFVADVKMEAPKLSREDREPWYQRHAKARRRK
jgi:hypothetical protein